MVSFVSRDPKYRPISQVVKNVKKSKYDFLISENNNNPLPAIGSISHQHSGFNVKTT